ncbi:hypothetical protein V2W45_514672 [Cenococcum geophilum]
MRTCSWAGRGEVTTQDGGARKHKPGTLDTSQAPHRAAFAPQGRTLPPCTIALAKGIIVFTELFTKLHPLNLLLSQPKLASSILLQESFSARTFWLVLALTPRHLMSSTYLLRAIHNCTRQAPNLAVSQHEQIRDMILSKSLRNAQVARIARCSMRSIRSIRTIRTNLRCFGTTKAPPNRAGRPRSITPPMLSALCDRKTPHVPRRDSPVPLGRIRCPSN